MKPRIMFLLALGAVLSMLLLINSDPRASAQQRRLATYDTGIFTLGQGQKLRVSVATGDVNGDTDLSVTDAVAVRFNRLGYIEQGNVLRIASQLPTDPITLMPNEAVSVDIPRGQFAAVRGIVSGNYIGTDAARAPARVTVQIIDEASGEVQSFLTALLLP